jgi:hypothetical protein
MTNLIFTEVPNQGKKTKRWLITSVRNGETLAYIEFRPGWRKYVWGMMQGVIFDEDCTMEVVIFLKQHAGDRQ